MIIYLLAIRLNRHFQSWNLQNCCTATETTLKGGRDVSHPSTGGCATDDNDSSNVDVIQAPNGGTIINGFLFTLACFSLFVLAANTP